MRDIRDLIAGISGSKSSAHAYIIEGPSGDARDAFIKTLTAGLECTGAYDEGRPCGRCDACLQAAAGTNPDVVIMQKSGKSGYKTEDAAAFTERLGMRAYGRYLIGIIDEAELMSETVQNKLLKTLEEPAQDTIILLASARSDSLLSTVRSRCSNIRIQEYEGFESAADEEVSGDFMEGAFMLLTHRTPFHEFRDFLDKHIKSQEDAFRLIEIAEDKLRGAMKEGKAPGFCAERIEAAEKTISDISRGMDKNKALKQLYLKYSGHKA